MIIRGGGFMRKNSPKRKGGENRGRENASDDAACGGKRNS